MSKSDRERGYKDGQKERSETQADWNDLGAAIAPWTQDYARGYRAGVRSDRDKKRESHKRGGNSSRHGGYYGGSTGGSYTGADIDGASVFYRLGFFFVAVGIAWIFICVVIKQFTPIFFVPPLGVGFSFIFGAYAGKKSNGFLGFLTGFACLLLVGLTLPIISSSSFETKPNSFPQPARAIREPITPAPPPKTHSVVFIKGSANLAEGASILEVSLVRIEEDSLEVRFCNRGSSDTPKDAYRILYEAYSPSADRKFYCLWNYDVDALPPGQCTTYSALGSGDLQMLFDQNVWDGFLLGRNQPLAQMVLFDDVAH